MKQLGKITDSADSSQSNQDQLARSLRLTLRGAPRRDITTALWQWWTEQHLDHRWEAWSPRDLAISLNTSPREIIRAMVALNWTPDRRTGWADALWTAPQGFSVVSPEEIYRKPLAK